MERRQRRERRGLSGRGARAAERGAAADPPREYHFLEFRGDRTLGLELRLVGKEVQVSAVTPGEQAVDIGAAGSSPEAGPLFAGF